MTKTWTVVIVTLTLLACGCSHADKTAVRGVPATSALGLTTSSSDGDLPTSPAPAPLADEILTSPGEFPLPGETTTLTSVVALPVEARQAAIEELPALPMITPPALRIADDAEMKTLGQTGLPLMLPEVPVLTDGASGATLVPVPTIPRH